MKGQPLKDAAKALNIFGPASAADVAQKILNRHGAKLRNDLAGVGDPHAGIASPEQTAQALKDREEASRKLADAEARYKADPAASDRKRAAERAASGPITDKADRTATSKPTRPVETAEHVEALYHGASGANEADVANAGKVLDGMARADLAALAGRIGLKGMATKKAPAIAEAIRLRIQNRVGAALRAKMV